MREKSEAEGLNLKGLTHLKLFHTFANIPAVLYYFEEMQASMIYRQEPARKIEAAPLNYFHVSFGFIVLAVKI